VGGQRDPLTGDLHDEADRLVPGGGVVGLLPGQGGHPADHPGGGVLEPQDVAHRIEVEDVVVALVDGAEAAHHWQDLRQTPPTARPVRTAPARPRCVDRIPVAGAAGPSAAVWSLPTLSAPSSPVVAASAARRRPGSHSTAPSSSPSSSGEAMLQGTPSRCPASAEIAMASSEHDTRATHALSGR